MSVYGKRETILAAPIGYLAAQESAREKVFERHGINYWCEGHRTLGEVLTEMSVDPDEFVRELAAVDADPARIAPENWADAPTGALIEHLQSAHHLYLKQELPELSVIVGKVSILHGDISPELRELDDAFEWFRSDAEMLMRKEELVLFPMCLRLEEAETRPNFYSGTIEIPIREVTAQHTAAAYALERMCGLTHQFSPPQDSCEIYIEMLERLSRLNRNTHQHVHEENNILFPRALSREKALPANTP